MNNLSEILGFSMIVIGSLTFVGLCFWSMYDLNRDDKKHKKHKKA